MRLNIASALTGMIAIALAASAVADPAPPPKVPEVVVVGKKDQNKDHEEPAHQFVNEVTVEREGQIAQFGEPICPLVIGLPAAFNAAIVKRMLEDAAGAGVPTRIGRCEPNVVVMIADDGHELLEKLHTARQPIFEGMEVHALKTLLSEPGPVHVWQGHELLDEGGFPIGLPDPNVMGSHVVARNYAPSHLQQPFRQRIDTAFLVIDAKAVYGFTVMQIADYAALRALAMTRSPRGGSIADDSILTLFDTGRSTPNPAGLSKGDAAYLHALYATSNSVSAAAQKSSIARSMMQALSTPDAPKAAQ